MANPFFKFKQFTVRHDRCGMKVTTEGCLFGAWICASNMIPDRVLDVGAGSGLLMLMLAQRYDAEIKGLEVDASAAQQCAENIAASPWKDRLEILREDARNWKGMDPFDMIVSNPPFHTDSLKTGDTSKDLARHDEGLRLSELFDTVIRNLEDDGLFAMLYPDAQVAMALDLAKERGLHPVTRTRVRQTPRHKPFRSMLLFRKQEGGRLREEEILIRTEDGAYSSGFDSLLREYYL